MLSSSVEKTSPIDYFHQQQHQRDEVPKILTDSIGDEFDGADKVSSNWCFLSPFWILSIKKIDTITIFSIELLIMDRRILFDQSKQLVLLREFSRIA